MNRYFSDTSSWADGQAQRPSVRPRIDFYKLSVTSVTSVTINTHSPHYAPKTNLPQTRAGSPRQPLALLHHPLFPPAPCRVPGTRHTTRCPDHLRQGPAEILRRVLYRLIVQELGGTYPIDTRHLSPRYPAPFPSISAATQL